MNTELTVFQKRVLAVLTAVGILFGAYFLRGYFILIVVAAVAAYLFTPLYRRLGQRFGTGVSAALTLLGALGMVVIPVSALGFVATIQITRMIESVSKWVGDTDMTTLGQRAFEVVNDVLARVPFVHVQLTPDTLRQSIASLAENVGQGLLQVLQSAVGSVASAVAASIIFLYVFVSLLVKQDKVLTLVRQLNPLGAEITDLYLDKIGAMVRGTVKGQFVIAMAQGVAGAASVYIAGFRQGFFFFAILLTALSIIPLGGGIVTIPFGIGMIVFGHPVGGLFVIAWHILVVSNIDNVLRPILVPRGARLDPALMLLAVFSGIAAFGFWGIVLGPVLMIVIVTTIDVYLAVYKGVPFGDADTGEPEVSSRPWWKRGRSRAAG
ncbi:AI-2E family transporter [Mycobacterium sp. CBMA271]|uniref:AI-2E family transporter n=1 Tax=unclassified Mycobacteroides TaxID=2618759 RepID=UPI001326D9EB|nr:MULTISPECIES: AI-2E family transporter [unclassified Mycobacteroides]MUM18202.1 AI-2E family transporter [Mycobacteroides sp. CBMA 326]MUM20789.1 AI-2E family transporter [Mycobacteroides sp. CBMA 271]